MNKINENLETKMLRLINTNKKPVISKVEHTMIEDNDCYISYQCGSCNEKFGLNSAYLDKLSEVNYKFTCPYCSKEAFLKDI